MIPKEPCSPKNEQQNVSEGSRSRSRGEPLVQKGMDRVKYWERALEFNRKIIENTNRERTAEK